MPASVSNGISGTVVSFVLLGLGWIMECRTAPFGQGENVVLLAPDFGLLGHSGLGDDAVLLRLPLHAGAGEARGA